MLRRSILVVGIALAFVAGSAVSQRTTGVSWVRPKTILAQGDCQTFPETGKTVCGIFLSYWRANGGLAQQGYPISDVFKERSSNGQIYDTQYFERAVFEHHPENRGTRYEVLLSLLGREKYEARYPAGLPQEAPLQVGQVLTLPGSKQGITFRVRIDGIEERAELPYGYGEGPPTRARGKYVVTAMRAENLGLESDSMSSGIRLKDSRGRMFDLVEFAIQRGGAKLLNRLPYFEDSQPGIAVDTVMVFDVAPDATGFSLVPPTR